MRILLLALFAVSICLSAPSCKKEDSKVTRNVCTGDCVTRTGVISQQGFTSYMYGTHILTTDDGEQYVLTSDVLDLDRRVGQKCIVILKDLDYRVEIGPPLYNVVVLRPAL